VADRRILLKLSGEILCPPGGTGVDAELAWKVAHRIRSGLEGASTELSLVIGGGNILRGAQLSAVASTTGEKVIDRISGDHMGMLATVINALGLRAALERIGCRARVLSALRIPELVEPFDRRTAIRALESGEIVLFAGGTGHPFFTTDTTASLRALQIGASQVAKGTKVRGVYSDDPFKNPSAEFYPRLRFQDVLERRLRIMDAASISLCMDNALQVQVFDMWSAGNIERVLAGDIVGTIIE
jgi:uridylate kinase